ncbi:class I SAM-dependent methyltransferase [Azospirillum argentinense]|uniref:Class I SAM-dependent methyltransferase n=1 Tax=Azospirillum argentinense TaxID=2970906 RepID=A0ABW8V826_9PROT
MPNGRNRNSTFDAGDMADWYPPLMIGAEELGTRILQPTLRAEALALLERLTPDAYTTYIAAFLREGERRYGANWRYADIVTVLLELARTLQPAAYLEIGVRRGRSAAAVAKQAPACAIIGFDLWQAGYAGIENPGPDFVRDELRRLGHQGTLELVSGNSHRTVPEYLVSHPNARFDLIVVDGDHSAEGARQDLLDVLPRLNVGGAIVFDDVDHPAHPELRAVWRDIVADRPDMSAWQFDGVGYGVAFALRRHG